MGVSGVLEAVHGHLAEHGGDLALEALGEQRQPGRRVGRVREQPSEGDGLAEHRRGLGEGQRGGLVEDPLLAGEVGVQPVTQLVGEGQHVAAPAGPVEQQVGMRARHGVGAEGARRLPGRIGASIQLSSMNVRTTPASSAENEP